MAYRNTVTLHCLAIVSTTIQELEEVIIELKQGI